MEERLNELVKRTTLLGALSVGSLLVDPTGSSGLLIGILGNAAFEQIKKLGKAVSAFSPSQVFQPDFPLNQALGRAIAKSLQFAVGSNTLKAFKATQDWEVFTPSEKKEIKEACKGLRRVAAGEVESVLHFSGLSETIEKGMMNPTAPGALSALEEGLLDASQTELPESFVRFLFSQIEETVGAFFWNEVVGSESDPGPFQEYASLVFQGLQHGLSAQGGDIAEILTLLEARESELKPEEVVSAINAAIEEQRLSLSAEQTAQFDALRRIELETQELVREGTRASLESMHDVKRLLTSQGDAFRDFIEDLQKPPEPRLTVEELIEQFSQESSEVMGWPKILSSGQALQRPELRALRERFDSQKSTTTLLLGPPGSGKSALFAELAASLKASNIPFFGFRSDTLKRDIEKIDQILPELSDSEGVCNSIRRVGASSGVVILIDQLDSVSSIVDKHPDRLTVVLRLIRNLDKATGVHIVAACREFEKAHDHRLASLDFHSVTLSLPPWKDVQPILSENGFTIPEEASTLREILRNPLHLSDFLRDADPGDEFSSVQALLEKVWEKRVLSTGEAELLELVAQRMLNDEELWIPRSVADGRGEELTSLVSRELLKMRNNGRSLGFHHQTYFDFALARAFSKTPGFSISEHVLDNGHDGLFVRPLLLSVLGYLRGGFKSQAQYEKEAVELVSRSRFHIRQLVIGFVGKQANPSDAEKAMMMPLLKGDNDQAAAIRAITGSSGWARALIEERDLLSQMASGDQEMCDRISGFLSYAVTVFPEEVAALIRDHWLPRPELDYLSCWVLRGLPKLDDIASEVTKLLAARVDSTQFSRMVYAIGEHSPETLPELIVLNLRGAIDLAKSESEGKLKEKQEEESGESQYESATWIGVLSHNSHLKPLENILNSDLYLGVDLGRLAEAAPEPFIDSLWPLYVELLECIAEGRGEAGAPEYHYRDDSIRAVSDMFHGRESLYHAIRTAVGNLAKSKPEQFLTFANSAEEIDLMSVHLALADGYAHLAEVQPREVAEYVKGNHARLLLGGRFNNEVEKTGELMVCASGLSESERGELEAYVTEFFDNLLPASREFGDEETADQYRNFCERQLVRVLQSFPEGTLSQEGLNRIEGKPEHVGGGIRMRKGGVVGPRNTAEELEGRTEEELLRIAEELPDETEWHGPDRQVFWSDGVERAGGAVQQSREFSKLAEKEPERFLQLLDSLQPGRQELYASRIIEGVIQSGHGVDEVTEAILRLVERGFNSNEFRESITRQSEELARQNEGLDPRLIEILLGWLENEDRPRPDQIQEVDYDSESSLIFGQKSWSSHGGREALFSTISRAYACSADNLDSEWLDLVEKCLETEKNSDVWANVLLRMSWFFSEDPERATRLAGEILANFPGAALHPAGSRGVAEILVGAKPLREAESWVKAFEKATLDRFKMLAGELYPLLAFHSGTARTHLEELTEARECPDALLAGLVRSVQWLWNALGNLKPLGLEILRRGLSSENSSIRLAASKLIGAPSKIVWDDPLKEYLREIRSSEESLLADPYGLTRALAQEIDNAPQEVLDVANAILAVGSEKLTDHSTSLPLAADTILQIAVGLHRTEQFREEGLALFEELLRGGLAEAKVALQTLERKP